MSDRYRERPLLHPRSRSEWRAWLANHHADTDGAWLARWTRSSGRPPAETGIEYEEIVEEALCFGWIDSLVNTLQDGRSYSSVGGGSGSTVPIGSLSSA